jgi:hypothetical protein
VFEVSIKLYGSPTLRLLLRPCPVTSLSCYYGTELSVKPPGKRVVHRAQVFFSSQGTLQKVIVGTLIVLARAASTSWEHDIASLLPHADLGSITDILDGLHGSSQDPNCQAGAKFTGKPDAKDPSCFFLSLCVKPGWSLRGCCDTGNYYVAPTPDSPLGSCLPISSL